MSDFSDICYWCNQSAQTCTIIAFLYVNAYDAYDEINSSKPLIYDHVLDFRALSGYIIFSSPVKFFFERDVKILVEDTSHRYIGKIVGERESEEARERECWKILYLRFCLSRTFTYGRLYIFWTFSITK